MKKFLFACISNLVILYQIQAQDLWHHSDLDADGVPGISLNKAMQYLEGRPSKKVTVAIIDSGYEITHDAFKDKVWTNKEEVAGNGKDDDGNGFIDDINGWNFIGGPQGNVINETMELTREYRRLLPKFKDAEPSKSKEYKYWKEIEEAYLKEKEEAFSSAKAFLDRYNGLRYDYQLLSGYARVDTLSVEAMRAISSEDSVILVARQNLGGIVGYLGGSATIDQILALLDDGYQYYDYQYNYAYNLGFNPRVLVGDDLTDLDEKGYGNAEIYDVSGFGGSHGTHVAGIVGGKDYGIVKDVEFMFLRTVPSGDERDKDVANSIIYAVDNGAQVINMSFGKGYSPDQEYVREAVRYAEEKGVLMVHAAGNDGKNNDKSPSYPDGSISRKKKSDAWIEVGASSAEYSEELPANFSNYGKQNVDLFAPGVQILSSVPGNSFEPNSGTSMASPVVAGVSALLLSYFPDLSALEVKEILMKSVTEVDLEVTQPGSDKKVKFSSLSKTGGIVNAYEAVKLADQRVKLESK
ncbi:MAG: S8 family serine peptidase [Bacteroidota bacterium]